MNPQGEKKYFLTDDGELIDPLPTLETEDEQDEKSKHKRLPESKLIMLGSRRSQPSFTFPARITLLRGLGLLLLVFLLMHSPTCFFVVAFLLVIGILAFYNSRAGSFGQDWINQPIRRLPPYRDPGDDQMRYW